MSLLSHIVIILLLSLKLTIFLPSFIYDAWPGKEKS